MRSLDGSLQANLTVCHREIVTGVLQSVGPGLSLTQLRWSSWMLRLCFLLSGLSLTDLHNFMAFESLPLSNDIGHVLPQSRGPENRALWEEKGKKTWIGKDMTFDILRRAVEMPKACKEIVDKGPFQEYLGCIQMSLKTKPQWRRDAFALLLPKCCCGSLHNTRTSCNKWRLAFHCAKREINCNVF